MVFRESVFVLFLLVNLFAYAAMRQSVLVWVKAAERQRRALNILCLALLLINIPLALFFVRDVNWTLQQIPAPLLKVVFYPSTAWLRTGSTGLWMTWTFPRSIKSRFPTCRGLWKALLWCSCPTCM